MNTDFLLMALYSDKEAKKQIKFREFVLDIEQYFYIKSDIETGKLFYWMDKALKDANISVDECWIKFKAMNSKAGKVEDFSDEILHFVRK